MQIEGDGYPQLRNPVVRKTLDIASNSHGSAWEMHSLGPAGGVDISILVSDPLTIQDTQIPSLSVRVLALPRK